MICWLARHTRKSLIREVGWLFFLIYWQTSSLHDPNNRHFPAHVGLPSYLKATLKVAPTIIPNIYQPHTQSFPMLLPFRITIFSPSFSSSLRNSFSSRFQLKTQRRCLLKTKTHPNPLIDEANCNRRQRRELVIGFLTFAHKVVESKSGEDTKFMFYENSLRDRREDTEKRSSQTGFSRATETNFSHFVSKSRTRDGRKLRCVWVVALAGGDVCWYRAKVGLLISVRRFHVINNALIRWNDIFRKRFAASIQQP